MEILQAIPPEFQTAYGITLIMLLLGMVTMGYFIRAQGRQTAAMAGTQEAINAMASAALKSAAEAEDEKQSLYGTMMTVQDRMSTLHRENEVLRAEYQEYKMQTERVIGLLQSQARQHYERAERAEQRVQELTTEVIQLRESRMSLSQRMDGLRNDADELRGMLTEFRAANEALQQRIQQMMESASMTSARIASLEESVADWKARYGALDTRYAKLKIELEDVKRERDDAQYALVAHAAAAVDSGGGAGYVDSGSGRGADGGPGSVADGDGGGSGDGGGDAGADDGGDAGAGSAGAGDAGRAG